MYPLPHPVALERKLKSVCPIRGLDVYPDSVSIVYDGTETPDQRAEAEEILAGFDWMAEQRRQGEYDETLAAGFLVHPEGWILRLTDDARIQMAQLVALCDSNVTLGVQNELDIVDLYDSGGAERTVTIHRLRQIAAAYGAFYRAALAALRGGA